MCFCSSPLKKKTLETLVEIFYFYSHMNQYGWQYTYIQYHIGVYDIRENVFDQNNWYKCFIITKLKYSIFSHLSEILLLSLAAF